jgi:dihydroneopterin aldolase
MDTIHIDQLRFKGKHGVYAQERRVEQEFEVSIKIMVDTASAGKSDAIGDTVNYEAIKNTVEEVIQGSSRYLIEVLAEDIATRTLADSQIHSVEVTIRKTAVWDNGVPGVTILRTRQ